jgi:phospholipid/cholesterol/gamma-HCH transport system substrate-binding protein
MSEPHYKLYGLAGVILIAGLVAVTVADYLHMFTPAVSVTVRADRSGLLMSPGADVTLRGVTVGKVRSVRPVNGSAVLDVDLFPSEVPRIRSDVTAQILAPTVFGPKYVDLVPSPGSGARPIADGALIESPKVGIETNSVFQHTVDLLRSFNVDKLNAALGGMATALRGRGDETGQLIEQLNTYLKELRPSYPALRRDIAQLPTVAGVYADVAPNLLTIGDNLTVTSQTLVDKNEALRAFLVDLTGLADKARNLLTDNGTDLRDTMSRLAPVTALTARYSPMFPCLFAGLEQMRRTIEPIVGGAQPGIHIITNVLPSQRGYENPRDLPVVAEKSAPSCYGGPMARGAPFTPYVRFHDGSHVFEGTDDRLSAGEQPLAVTLFGPAVDAHDTARGGK